MDDLIRRGAVLEYPFQRGKQSCDEKNANPHFLNGIASVIEFAEALPSVDAVEVVHARWIEEPEHIPHCSRCKLYSDDADYGRANYCPGCGARMDAQTDGEKEAKQDG